jgi:hypothetical protein
MLLLKKNLCGKVIRMLYNDTRNFNLSFFSFVYLKLAHLTMYNLINHYKKNKKK